MAHSTPAQLTFDSFNVYLDAVEAHAPKPPVLRRSRVSLLPLAEEHLRTQIQQGHYATPTHEQVYYWSELAGALTLCGTTGMSDDRWPDDLNPTEATLKTLVERRLIVRRGRAWHLRRDWYTCLSAFKRIAVDQPLLSEVERPAPDLPSYVELKQFENICRYLDDHPKNRVRLPFDGLVTGQESIEGNVPITALRQMRRYRLVRHMSSCEWALSPKWQERLKLLWRGVNTALRDYQPPQLAPSFPRSLVAGIDTWHLNWLVEHPLPSSLRERLDRWQEVARDEESEIETDLLYDGAPLMMYRWGTKAEKGKGSAGVSWGYVLLNRSVRLLIRKSPLGGIIAQARLGSECLWRRTPRGALDELTLLMKRLWRGQKGWWQVSQVHLCHDVANLPLSVEMLSRFVSRSQHRVTFEAAQAEVAQVMKAQRGDAADELLLETIDWEAEFSGDDPLTAFSPFSPFDDVFVGEDGGVGGWPSGLHSAETKRQHDTPIEERASAVYQYGKRLSGLAFSPGGAISVAIYLKRFESLLHRKVHMFPLWKAAGWNEEDEVTRIEPRLRRDALRELRLPGVDHASLDDPYEMLNHLEGIFGLIVGRLEDCPDAVNTAWVRLVVPRDDESNRSRWDTDPTWRVVQSASFSPAPAESRRVIRRKQRSLNIKHLVAGSYGYLASFIAEQQASGEQWDVSRAARELVRAWENEAAKPGKEFGELVRKRRKASGFLVLPREEILPALPEGMHKEHRKILPVLPSELDLPLLFWEEERRELRPLLRKRCAELRMHEAFQRLAEAELRQESTDKLVWYEAQYEQELATYTATCMLPVTGMITE